MAIGLGACPACGKALELNSAQQAKVEAALAALQDGTHLKLGCPHCRQPVKIGRDGRQIAPEQPAAKPSPQEAKKITPPGPPDLSWLDGEETTGDERLGDVPLALILAGAGPREQIVAAYAGLGFHPVLPDSPEQAIDRMRFTEFKAVAYHTGFEPTPLRGSVFHQHMRQLAMNKRRYIHYLVAGPDRSTLYDLEALAESANLTVNDRDLARLSLILRKGLADHENLFGPYIAALREFGKK